MSLHSDTLFWFRANQSLLLLLNAAYLAENKQLNYVHALYFRKFVEHLKIIYLHVHVYYMYPVYKFNVKCNQYLSLCTLCNVDMRGLGLWCLTPLSTIFQLYGDRQFIDGGNHGPVSHWQTLSNNVVSRTPRHEWDSNSQL